MKRKCYLRFNTHSPHLAGTHAFLGASNYYWINYSDDKLDYAFTAHMQARRGVELHEFARQAIRLGQRLPDTPTTMNMYVNDAIGFRMTPEQMLYYSPNCYGTADTISFRRDQLRIHDLKTGITKTSENQLYVYAALFCLEYGFKPHTIETELRIYQNDEIRTYEAYPETILHIMDKIIAFDKRIDDIRLDLDL
jgi:hypothetical protein